MDAAGRPVLVKRQTDTLKSKQTIPRYARAY